jgi:hypothetical protein
MPQIDLSILNQRQTPAFYADVLANRPAAGFIGRIFVSTNTFEFYRDNGTGWDLIGGPGAGTVTGSGAAGQVTYWNGASTVTGDNGLFYDSVNDRLGIATTTPGAAIDAHSTQSTILQLNQTAINDTRIAFQLSGAALWRIGNFYNGGANDFELFDVIGAQATFTVKKTSGQVLIGTSTVGSGKLVVASATGDNGVQIVGASAPSLRIDNAASGPTKRAGLGISTAVNNFIQGSVDRDFCIFNGSTAAASPMLFGIYDAGLTNVQEAARISAARNLIVNSTTDSGERLQVNGTTIIKSGLGAVSTNAFQITGSGGNLLNIRGFGDLFLNGSGASINIGSTTNIGVGTFNLNSNQGTGNSFFSLIHNNSNTAIRVLSNTVIQLNPVAGNVLIGTTTDAGFKLDVNGTIRASGAIRTDAGNSVQALLLQGTSGSISATPSNAISSINLNSQGITATLSCTANNYYDLRSNAQAASLRLGTTLTSAGGGIEYYASNNGAYGYHKWFYNNVQYAQLTLAQYVLDDSGTLTGNSSAILQANSTTKGFLPPRMTTAQKNAIVTPAAGLVVYDTTLNKLAVFTGVTWETITSV